MNEQERNLKFPLTDLVVIRKFAEIAEIQFDETKFHNREEFRMYIRSLMKKKCLYKRLGVECFLRKECDGYTGKVGCPRDLEKHLQMLMKEN